jgi:hypothetical protein
LPPWIKRDAAKDNWQTTAWQQRQTQCAQTTPAQDEHF